MLYHFSIIMVLMILLFIIIAIAVVFYFYFFFIIIGIPFNILSLLSFSFIVVIFILIVIIFFGTHTLSLFYISLIYLFLLEESIFINRRCHAYVPIYACMIICKQEDDSPNQNLLSRRARDVCSISGRLSREKQKLNIIDFIMQILRLVIAS